MGNVQPQLSQHQTANGALGCFFRGGMVVIPISFQLLFNPADEKLSNLRSDIRFADFVPYPQKPLAHFFPSVRVTEQVGNFVSNPFWCRRPTDEFWHDDFAEDSVWQSEGSKFEDIDSSPTKPMGLQAIQKPHPEDNDRWSPQTSCFQSDCPSNQNSDIARLQQKPRPTKK